ncbi:MAG: hypothetical protein ACE5HZ_04025 [Fidelibacterota bacterium]
MSLIKATVVLSVVGWMACSSTREGVTGGSFYSANYIHPEEIRKSGATNAFDLIKQLRPLWVSGRGATSVLGPGGLTYPAVYVNGMLYGDITSLRSITTEAIKEIEFLNPRDAVGLGMQYPNGAIFITLL